MKKQTTKKQTKKTKRLGFQILHFYGSFSNDIMAVTGLRFHLAQEHSVLMHISLLNGCLLSVIITV